MSHFCLPPRLHALFERVHDVDHLGRLALLGFYLDLRRTLLDFSLDTASACRRRSLTPSSLSRRMKLHSSPAMSSTSMAASPINQARKPLQKSAKTTEESNKVLVLEALDTLCNKPDYKAAERHWSGD
jgi:hypothetical protein